MNWNKEIELDELVVDRYEGEKAARKYLSDNRRKAKRKKIVTGVVATMTVIGCVVTFTHCTSNKEVPASTKETETTIEETTEEETTTEIITADFECVVREVVGNTITVEHDDNLYSFYGNGYAKGQKVICTFTEDMKVIDASEPIEEPTTEIKFYDVPLSEELQLHIFSECEKYNLSPALVIAIIERESTYNADRVGDNGKSLGIMQIQPKWHNHRVDELGIVNFNWFNPYHNISVGCHYLAELYGKYGDDVYTVLMGYNGSPKYVRDMINAGKISDYALEVSARAEELEK